MGTIRNMQIHGINYDLKAKYDSDGNEISKTYSKISDLNIHVENKSNPHNVTKAQVGLENVDNTSDLDKPISTATQEALNSKASTTDLVGKKDSSQPSGEIFNDYSNNVASGQYSHAEGTHSISSGDYSHTENYDTVAIGTINHVEGQSTYVYSKVSHAEGQNSICKGNYSHAEGGGSYTVSVTGEANSLNYIINTEGNSFDPQLIVNAMNQSQGFRIGLLNSTNSNRCTIKSATLQEDQSISITLDKTLSTSAISNTSYKLYSHVVYGQTAHIENMCNYGGGNQSHTEGVANLNFGEYSHVEGQYNVSYNRSEHSEGNFNVSLKGEQNQDKTLHTVGMGTSQSDRKNADQIMFNGDRYIYGVGGFDGTNYNQAETVQEVINNKADAISTISSESGEVTKTIEPNKLYKFGEVSSLNITLGSEIPNIYNEYMFEFTSGDTPTVLTLPETVKWIGDSLVDNNKTYQVSIVNSIAVMGGA